MDVRCSIVYLCRYRCRWRCVKRTAHSHIDFSIFLASIHSFSGIMYREMSEYYLFINKICKRGHLSYAWIGSGSSQSMWMWLWHERKRRERKTCNSTTIRCRRRCACSILNCIVILWFLTESRKLIYQHRSTSIRHSYCADDSWVRFHHIDCTARKHTFRMQRCLTY